MVQFVAKVQVGLVGCGTFFGDRYRDLGTTGTEAGRSIKGSGPRSGYPLFGIIGYNPVINCVDDDGADDEFIQKQVIVQ